MFVLTGFYLPAIDGKSVTWYEPPPVVTALSQSDVFDPSISQLYEGSPGSLSWNYSLRALSIALVVIKFNGASIVTIQSNGQANEVAPDFKERFSIRSTSQSATLIISSVTAADDKANGDFSCELITTASGSWSRNIQVEVVGKLTVRLQKPGPSRQLKPNQSQSRTETIDSNIFKLSQSNAGYKTMKSQLIR